MKQQMSSINVKKLMLRDYVFDLFAPKLSWHASVLDTSGPAKVFLEATRQIVTKRVIAVVIFNFIMTSKI